MTDKTIPLFGLRIKRHNGHRSRVVLGTFSTTVIFESYYSRPRKYSRLSLICTVRASRDELRRTTWSIFVMLRKLRDSRLSFYLLDSENFSAFTYWAMAVCWDRVLQVQTLCISWYSLYILINKVLSLLGLCPSWRNNVNVLIELVTLVENAFR